MSVENTHIGARGIAEAMKGVRKIFFIGIGGISMSALARISLLRGYGVGGSDRGEGALLESLESLGIKIFKGHDANHLTGYDAVVYTVAISEENPEYRAAKEKGLPLFSRADYLNYLMTGYEFRVGVAGMHGKSTCTAMCSRIFLASGDPTVLCGAPLPEAAYFPCRIGKGNEQFVFEACEYMDSFLDFSPTLAVILNIAMDHVDYFHSMEQIRASFLAYARRTGEGGTVLYNADDAESVLALSEFEGRHVTFGIEKSADFTARNIQADRQGTSFDLCRGEELLTRISLRVHGKHMVYNALAAAGAAILGGVELSAVVKGLGEFVGAGRRMEYKGLCNGAHVYDDYGHHPDEIRATLAGAREMGFDRILCAYQPHTYSRTAGLLEEFSTAFGDADFVYFADIYAAREQNIFGVSSALLAEKIGDKATYCGSFEALAEVLRRDARQGDLVIVMGAGDIYKTFDLLIE